MDLKKKIFEKINPSKNLSLTTFIEEKKLTQVVIAKGYYLSRKPRDFQVILTAAS
jgi:hypothetical protein